MGDNREKDKEASKNLTSDAESDILKKIDLAFQVTISFTCPKTMIVIWKAWFNIQVIIKSRLKHFIWEQDEWNWQT